MAHKLYVVLTSYLKGPALQLSRLLGESKNGLRLWQLLTNQYSPKTRQRSLAISQAITSFPCFSDTKSLAESIASLEQLVRVFEVVNNKEFDKDILLGVLLRCSPAIIRQHLTLTMSSSTTYDTAKEMILGYERSSRTWDMAAMIKDVQAQPSNAIHSSMGLNQGPAAMEVDQV